MPKNKVKAREDLRRTATIHLVCQSSVVLLAYLTLGLVAHLSVLACIILLLTLGVSYSREAIQRYRGTLPEDPIDKMRRELDEAREAELLRETKELRRQDVGSLGIRALRRFVDLKGAAFDKDKYRDGLQPVLTIDMDDLTESQAELIDSYLEGAEITASTFKIDDDESAQAIDATGDIFVYQSAAELAKALMMDAYMRELLDGQFVSSEPHHRLQVKPALG